MCNCPYCDYSTDSKPNLDQHINWIHRDERYSLLVVDGEWLAKLFDAVDIEKWIAIIRSHFPAATIEAVGVF